MSPEPALSFSHRLHFDGIREEEVGVSAVVLVRMLEEYEQGGCFFDPDPEPEVSPLRDEDEALSTLRQAATTGPRRRLSATGWLVLGSLVAAVAGLAWALWGAM